MPLSGASLYINITPYPKPDVSCRIPLFCPWEAGELILAYFYEKIFNSIYSDKEVWFAMVNYYKSSAKYPIFKQSYLENVLIHKDKFSFLSK